MTTANRNRPPTQVNFTTRVKVALIQRGLTVTALAKRLRRSRNGVSIAINHPGMFKELQALIAREVGL